MKNNTIVSTPLIIIFKLLYVLLFLKYHLLNSYLKKIRVFIVLFCEIVSIKSSDDLYSDTMLLAAIKKLTANLFLVTENPSCDVTQKPPIVTV